MKKGVPASPGIGIGKVYILEEAEIIINEEIIDKNEIPGEIQGFKEAVKKSKEQIKEIYDASLSKLGKEESKIIESHLMIVEDPFFIEEVIKRIENDRIKAEYGTKKVMEDQIKIFEGMDDPYIKERATDIRDVGTRILKNILGIPINNLRDLDDDYILVGQDITPSQMASADREHIKGIVSELGGKTSHTAIIAQTMDIPAVLGAKGILNIAKRDEIIAIDGAKGIIELNLDSDKKSYYLNKQEKQRRLKKELIKIKDIPSKTKDGKYIELAANIGKPEDTSFAMENGAEGVGLFRTEFLYMDKNTFPSEDEQFHAYKSAVEGMKGKPIIIRTLDVGGDKEISYFNLPKEANPFLGWRAIRICLEEKELFKTQLRAILRASVFGKIRIMYPMISSVEEVIKANKILREAMGELVEKDIDFDKDIEVGIMVEIPSAAITADLIASEVDFFSIGTNDLTQYTLAADRINEKVSNVYDNFHPGVLRLIQNVIDVSHKHNKFTGMCGEFAGNPLATILLVGMGLDEFSMSPSSILKVKKIINSIDLDFAKRVANKALKLRTGSEISEYLREELKEIELEYIIET